MIITSNIKALLKNELGQAKSVWVASAMISHSGWLFLQQSLPQTATQTYLIGIDLATDPKVFESIIAQTDINARVYETKYTFHPKVYLIQKKDDTYTAFIGSSNTTNWGLEKNVEMNYQIHDQNECRKLLDWFNSLYSEGYLITKKFVDDYKVKFIKASIKVKEVDNEAFSLKSCLTQNNNQFFTKNHHEIFNKRFHRVNSEDLKKIRKEVRLKLLKLHEIIYPEFSNNGLTDLYCHHQSREIVSRHFFNQYSGNYINAMWLHYGKSFDQLQAYKSEDKSINRPNSFINNIRMQVIIHEDSLGIWLVLGRNNGSRIDRDYFRSQMQDPIIQRSFFDAFKKLGNEYWINVSNGEAMKNLNTPTDLLKEIQKETIDEYFIIGCEIDWLDSRVSSKNISTTVLNEFKKLYPLYTIMRH
ncbi:phospholipase D-like domain-containing protein [Carboxylicivirga sp. N1Y90]|uniref:phospholipase D-like domain-containing protein n=1 Tax=Carboxylicivirga fragile TaxID=3417571 RepID=UPI003D3313E9|nr:NgoFVII family restriction endonuclease [Marinilabiliaceae bacterium N1Y90]